MRVKITNKTREMVPFPLFEDGKLVVKKLLTGTTIIVDESQLTPDSKVKEAKGIVKFQLIE